MMTSALILIGAGAVLAGAVGLALPPGERLSASLALVIGAGAGIVSLAITLFPGSSRHMEDDVKAFLIASVIGFVAVVASLTVLWRRARS